MRRTLVFLCATACSHGATPTPPTPEPTAPATTGAADPTPHTAQEVEVEAGATDETLLILPLQSSGDLKDVTTALDEMVLASTDALGRYRVLGQSDLNAMLGAERLKDAMGCSDVACAAEIGGALGAELMVAGALTQLKDQVVLSLRLMNTSTPAVLKRATVRGVPTADGLERMVEVAVGELFGAKVTSTTTLATPPPNATTYGAFTAMVAEFGKLMTNGEYTRIIDAVQRYEAADIAAPPGTDGQELLAYYRISACAALKQEDCVRRSRTDYVKRWPDGVYRAGVDGFVDRFDDERLARQDNLPELRERVADIRRLHEEGTIDEREAGFRLGYAYLGANHYREAAAHLRRVLAQFQQEPERAIDVVKGLVAALTQAGDFAAARKVLERARASFPRRFRRAGLHHQLRHLPR
jgi:hypothetical protein